MPTPDYYLKQHDTKEAIQATLSDQAGAVDLTGSSVKFLMRDKTGAVKVNAPAELVTPALGVVKYAWAAADVDTAGEFRAEWEATFPGGLIQTFPNDGFIAILITGDIA